MSNGTSATVRVGESLKLVNGRAFKPSEWKKSGLPIVRIQNLNDPDAPFNYYEGQLPEKFLLDNGDLLFAWSGTPGTSFGAHIWRGGKAWLNQHIFKVHFNEKQFNKRYLQLAINRNLQEYIRAAHGGAGLAHITKGRFEESWLSVPPLDEQERIVSEIEKQFTRLDAGVASLKRVQTELKRYRGSVLKAACEGRLVPTEAELARKENRSYETGEQLLQRILEERRQKWNGKGKYKEPTVPDTTGLPPLPEAWAWAAMPQLGELSRGKSKHRPRDDPRLYGGPYPFIQTGDIRRSAGTIREYTQTYSEYGLQQSRLWPKGTLCITIAANIAETGILNFKSCFPDSVVGFTHDGNAATTRYIEFFIRTAKERLAQFAPATAQKNINLDVLQKVAVPLPSLAEQTRIVAEAERRLSVLEELATVVSANLTRAIRLRQAILTEAFTAG